MKWTIAIACRTKFHGNSNEYRNPMGFAKYNRSMAWWAVTMVYRFRTRVSGTALLPQLLKFLW